MEASTAQVAAWYNENEAAYAVTEARLALTRAKFLSADDSTSVRMLKASYYNAVISQQTHVEKHEAAWTAWYGGMNVLEAMETFGVLYHNQKARWMADTTDDDYQTVVSYLKAGESDAAFDYLRDNFKGLSWKKSAFTLAMLGFTEFACIDTNVKQAMGFTDKQARTSSKRKYLGLVEDMCDRHDLGLSTFMTQWVVFDYQRGVHSEHATWFRAMGSYVE